MFTGHLLDHFVARTNGKRREATKRAILFLIMTYNKAVIIEKHGDESTTWELLS